MNCNLNFTNQLQEQTQWCWSAVASNVAAFYNAGSAWTQGSLANAELGQTSCTVNGGSTTCNVPWYLDRALQRVGRLRSWAAGTVSFGQCDTEICTAQRPMGVRIGWQGGGGHFVAIAGVGDNHDQLITVHDPWYGTNYTQHAQLVSNYQGSGSWTHTYYTT